MRRRSYPQSKRTMVSPKDLFLPLSQHTPKPTRKIDSKNLCIFCYKYVTAVPSRISATPTQRVELNSRYFKMVSRYLRLDVNLGRQRRKLDSCDGSGGGENLDVTTCDDCFSLIKSFCQFYDEMEQLRLKLGWNLAKLRGIMRCADKVPSRFKSFRLLFEGKGASKMKEKLDLDEFRRQFIHKSLKPLAGPRVSVSKLDNKIKADHEGFGTKLLQVKGPSPSKFVDGGIKPTQENGMEDTDLQLGVELTLPVSESKEAKQNLKSPKKNGSSPSSSLFQVIKPPPSPIRKCSVQIEPLVQSKSKESPKDKSNLSPRCSTPKKSTKPTSDRDAKVQVPKDALPLRSVPPKALKLLGVVPQKSSRIVAKQKVKKAKRLKRKFNNLKAIMSSRTSSTPVLTSISNINDSENPKTVEEIYLSSDDENLNEMDDNLPKNVELPKPASVPKPKNRAMPLSVKKRLGLAVTSEPGINSNEMMMNPPCAPTPAPEVPLESNASLEHDCDNISTDPPSSPIDLSSDEESNNQQFEPNINFPDPEPDVEMNEIPDNNFYGYQNTTGSTPPPFQSREVTLTCSQTITITETYVPTGMPPPNAYASPPFAPNGANMGEDSTGPILFYYAPPNPYTFE